MGMGVSQTRDWMAEAVEDAKKFEDVSDLEDGEIEEDEPLDGRWLNLEIDGNKVSKSGLWKYPGTWGLELVEKEDFGSDLVSRNLN